MICRFCNEPDNLQIVCSCQDTNKYAHTSCLEDWITTHKQEKCPMCADTFDYDISLNCYNDSLKVLQILLLIVLIIFIVWIFILNVV